MILTLIVSELFSLKNYFLALFILFFRQDQTCISMCPFLIIPIFMFPFPFTPFMCKTDVIVYRYWNPIKKQGLDLELHITSKLQFCSLYLIVLSWVFVWRYHSFSIFMQDRCFFYVDITFFKIHWFCY